MAILVAMRSPIRLCLAVMSAPAYELDTLQVAYEISDVDG